VTSNLNHEDDLGSWADRETTVRCNCGAVVLGVGWEGCVGRRELDFVSPWFDCFVEIINESDGGKPDVEVRFGFT